MAELKLYPVGIQTFEEIITRNLLYVDKTEYVYRMTHSGGKHFFLSRPRRYAPLLDVVHSDVNLPVLRNVMRNFYSPLKDCEYE